MPIRFSTMLRHGWPALLALGGCVESYLPDVAATSTSYLVVDGFINGNGRSTFRLSRSIGLASTTPPAEKGARLLLLDDAGGRYALTETSAAGTYRSDSLVLSAQRQYQLRIVVAGGATYASDLTPLKVTPPIDSLGWRAGADEVRLVLSTHDATDQAKYYRWGLTETWEFTSAFESNIEYDARRHTVVSRTQPAYRCWHTEQPTRIRQASTTLLSRNALLDYTLLAPSAHDERFKIRYSVLVTQVAETAAEFSYYEVLRKNTEAVGTVNDPLPAQLTGNVHRTDSNPTEPVLGFVGAHTVQTRRLFINRQQLPYPRTWEFTTPYERCMLADSLVAAMFENPAYAPVSTLKPGLYTGSTLECVDCRLRGSNAKPSFW